MDEEKQRHYLIKASTFLPLLGEQKIAERMAETWDDPDPPAIHFDFVDDESWYTHLIEEPTALLMFGAAARDGLIEFAYNPATSPRPGKIIVFTTYCDPEIGSVAVSAYIDDPRKPASAKAG